MFTNLAITPGFILSWGCIIAWGMVEIQNPSPKRGRGVAGTYHILSHLSPEGWLDLQNSKTFPGRPKTPLRQFGAALGPRLC